MLKLSNKHTLQLLLFHQYYSSLLQVLYLPRTRDIFLCIMNVSISIVPLLQYILYTNVRVNRCMILCQKSLFNLSNYFTTGAKKQGYPHKENKNRFRKPFPSRVAIRHSPSNSYFILLARSFHLFMGDCSSLVKSLHLLLHKYLSSI